MRIKITIDTESAAARLVALATGLNEQVYLTDGSAMRVSAKSLLGAIYAAFDFTEVWLETEGDYYHVFKDFVAD